MNQGDLDSILDQLRRELRSNSAFSKLPLDHQAWLVERLVIGDYNRLQDLAADLAARTEQKPWPLSTLWRLSNTTLKRLSSIEGNRTARREIVDRLTAGAVVANDIERLAKSALPGITQALAGLLGDRALSLVSTGSDPDETRQVLSDFLDAAAGARADRDLARKEGEASLERIRFQRDTCDLFLKWSADQRAADIASSNASNSDKIESLGRLMFGDAWK